jgi:N-acetylglutamate synthase-like GNAT family acetyltransferase
MILREDPARGEPPRPDAHVRAIRPDDVPLLQMIKDICLREDFPSHYTQQHIAALAGANGERAFERAMARGDQFLVAEMQGAVAGYASWAEDELLSTFVVPPAQGRGIGSLLVDACALDARTAGQPILRVRATLNAIDFFRSFGFLPTEPGFHEVAGTRIPYQLMVRQPQ